MVLKSRHGTDGVRLLDLLIESVVIEVVAIDFAHAKIRCWAFADFGKGPRPAGLNYGDCFLYGLARQLGEQQLTRGENFTCTDLAPGTVRCHEPAYPMCVHWDLAKGCAPSTPAQRHAGCAGSDPRAMRPAPGRVRAGSLRSGDS